MPETLTDDQLREKLREILEGWPLYRDFAYLGADDVVRLPTRISLHCPLCKREQWWEREEDPSSNDRRTFSRARYDCRNCGQRNARFYFFWGRNNESNAYLFLKVGQYPQLEERIPTALERQLKKGDDLEFYKRALRCRNFNFGIAALAYLRRVVENRMNDLLDLIAEAARQAGYSADELRRLAEVKASRVFDEKVTYAAAILPPNLRPGDTNPIDLLHDLASEGLHRLSDAECIDVFDQSRSVFEHLFIELRVREARDKAFSESLNQLRTRRSRS